MSDSANDKSFDDYNAETDIILASLERRAFSSLGEARDMLERSLLERAQLVLELETNPWRSCLRSVSLSRRGITRTRKYSDGHRYIHVLTRDDGDTHTESHKQYQLGRDASKSDVAGARSASDSLAEEMRGLKIQLKEQQDRSKIDQDKVDGELQKLHQQLEGIDRIEKLLQMLGPNDSPGLERTRTVSFEKPNTDVGTPQL